jgi:hypothetical protein
VVAVSLSLSLPPAFSSTCSLEKNKELRLVQEDMSS